MDQETIDYITQELSKALFRFSFGGLTCAECDSVARKYAPQLDFSDPGLGHKGINWCAQQIVGAMMKSSNKELFMA